MVPILLLLATPAHAHYKGLNFNVWGSPPAGPRFEKNLVWAKRAHVDVLRFQVYAPWMASPRSVGTLTRALEQMRADHIKALLTVWPASVAASAQAARLWHGFSVGIEIGNEPNGTPGWAPGYVRTADAAYRAVKRVSHLPVIVGALAYANPDDLAAMYAAGLHHFDAVSIHPYTTNVPPWTDPPDAPNLDFQTDIPALHNIMAEHGDGSKRIWITEMGWSTVGRYVYGDPSDQTRAEYERYVGRLTRSWSWIAGVIFFQMVDDTSPSTWAWMGVDTATERGLDRGLALLTRSWKPTASFRAFAATGY